MKIKKRNRNITNVKLPDDMTLTRHLSRALSGSHTETGELEFHDLAPGLERIDTFTVTNLSSITGEISEMSTISEDD